MLDGLEWDLCEFSLATYIAARSNGWPLRAVAIFPRRMFTMPLLFARTGAGITQLEQLVGRRVGIRSFHTTLCVWGLGDLESVYGVPLDQMTWVTERSDPFPVNRAEPWSTEQIGAGDSLEAALERGELDAVLVPRVPGAVWRGSAVPLLANPAAASRDYFARTGVFPIMHTIVVKDDVLAADPSLAGELRASFDEAKRIGYGLYQDPNWTMLADASEVLRAQQTWLGIDPYPYGLDANIGALERLIRYERNLGLIADDVVASSLFESE
jgi:4,5-dihydroxyphthalate decarboxylase